jgi:hypothetical protein
VAHGVDYRDRVIFPTEFLGKSTGFEARALLDTQKPKALYPEWQDTETLYTPKWFEKGKAVIVTESLIDAETFYGIGNAVGSYGVFQANQLSALFDLEPSSVIWAMDADQNSRIRTFVEYTLGIIPTYVLPMFAGEDPNSVGRVGLEGKLDKLLKVNTLWDLHPVLFDWEIHE